MAEKNAEPYLGNFAFVQYKFTDMAQHISYYMRICVIARVMRASWAWKIHYDEKQVILFYTKGGCEIQNIAKRTMDINTKRTKRKIDGQCIFAAHTSIKPSSELDDNLTGGLSQG